MGRTGPLLLGGFPVKPGAGGLSPPPGVAPAAGTGAGGDGSTVCPEGEGGFGEP